MFLGRKNELEDLNKKFKNKSAQLVVVYGRRRIGKSELLKTFINDKNHLFFEGLENQSQQNQINNILNMLAKQKNDPFIEKLNVKKWTEILDLLTNQIKNQKTKIVLIFDEFQWMANLRSPLVSLLKLYWDNHWKNQNVMVILCGSVAHFMVNKVVNSKALYGRINMELCLGGLLPSESRALLVGRGDLEVLKYLMIFGSVPKYLEEIDQSRSFEENLNSLCFKKNCFFINELDKVFYSQFREAQTYKKIIEALDTGNLSLAEIADKVKFSSGGGLKSYLSNLEQSGFIRVYTSIQQTGKRNQKYKLFDEFLTFYFKFMKPHTRQITENTKQQLFNLLVKSKWQPWLGIAFENFCLKNAMVIAEAAGFAEEVESFGPLFGSKDKNFQIDLIYNRTHELTTVCEIKFYSNPIGTSIIPEVKSKIARLKKKRGQTIERMLIAPMGADKHLLATQYFHHVITLKELLN